MRENDFTFDSVQFRREYFRRVFSYIDSPD